MSRGQRTSDSGIDRAALAYSLLPVRYADEVNSHLSVAERFQWPYGSGSCGSDGTIVSQTERSTPTCCSDGWTGMALAHLFERTSDHRFLDGADSLFQIDDDAFARTAGLGDTMSAVAQAAVSDLRHQGTGLGAANINCRH